MNITFNNVDLSQYIRVLDADRELLPSVDNSITKVTARNGGFFDWDRLEVKEITVKYALITESTEELQKLKRKLAGVLKTSEPKQLIFSDEPDVYYMAKLDSNTTMNQTFGHAEGTIKFICVDPLAYSLKTETVFQKGSTEPIKIDYKGTASAYPVVTAKFKSECGYLALINQDGQIVQIGNPDEMDKVPYKANEKVLEEKFEVDRSEWQLNSALMTYPHYLGNPTAPNIQKGSYDWTTNFDIAMPVFEANSGSYQAWHGPSLTRDIPADSEGSRTGNFIVKNRIDMIQGDVRQMGRIESNLQSGSDILAGFVIRDSSQSIQERMLELWIDNREVEVISLPLKDYRGFFEGKITRESDVITFRFSDIKENNPDGIVASKYTERSYRVSGIAKKPVDKVNLFMGKFNDAPPLTKMSWTDYQFIWVGVDKIQDVPNKFQNDDGLLVDFGSGDIFLNDIKELNLGALGNDFFALKQGENSIYPVCSEWAAVPPDIEITYREAYL